MTAEGNRRAPRTFWRAKLSVLLLFNIGYALYQWGFQQYRIDFGKRLAEFEKEQKEGRPPNSKDGRIVPRQKADIAYRLWDALNRSGWLIGGLVGGGPPD